MTDEREPWWMHLPLAQDRPLLAYGVTTALMVLVCAIRYALLAVLPNGVPFALFFPVIVGAAVVFGLRAGVLAGLLGLVMAWYFFVPPVGFALGAETEVALALYAAVILTLLVLIHLLQQASARARAEREISLRLTERLETLFHELQHRIGNNLQMVSALLSLQKRKLADPAAAEAIEAAAQRVNLIGRIQRQLYDPGGNELAMADLLERVVHDLIETSGRQDLDTALAIPGDLRIHAGLAIPTSLIVAEAVANAIEHGFVDGTGTITIEVAQEPGWIAITVADDGCGLPDGFVFETSQNLGLKLSASLARQFEGSFALNRINSRTLAVLRLPHRLETGAG